MTISHEFLSFNVGVIRGKSSSGANYLFRICGEARFQDFLLAYECTHITDNLLLRPSDGVMVIFTGKINNLLTLGVRAERIFDFQMKDLITTIDYQDRTTLGGVIPLDEEFFVKLDHSWNIDKLISSKQEWKRSSLSFIARY